jgi:beta-galactosidase
VHQNTPSATNAAVAWPTDGLSFGGDYNPEQWAPEVCREDIRLMREAGVNIVTLGVFSWQKLEPTDGHFDWSWLDEIIGLLHEAGIAITLATPTAAPPNWLLRAHPEILPVDADMVAQHPGGRLGWCPSSPVFRRYAVRMAEQLAQRYGRHPMVRLWHISNELGGGNARCYCDVSVAAFRGWLRQRYPSIDDLNAAWGTAFWGHGFTHFDEVQPPRGPLQSANPAQFLDFQRFSSDELLQHFLAEADVVRRSSDAPVTTNFMVNAGGHVANYQQWAPHMDVVANDHYTIVADPDRAHELAYSADRMRGLTRNRAPWLLMEHSTGAPSWQERNRAKDPGEILRNALAHVARGSDGAMFFQWRASLSGAEQFHSAMLPHAGTASRVWREIVELGDALKSLAPILGSPVEPARVALLADEESAWAYEHGLKPHRALRYAREPRLWHQAFWNRQVLVDVLPAHAALDGYSLVIVPSLLIVDAAQAERIAAFVRAGGSVLITYLSGIVDENSRVLPGGYPGAFRDLLGVTTEEFRPLQRDEVVQLDDGTEVSDWTEDTLLHGAQAVVHLASGVSAGRPAITTNRFGSGSAWYVAAAVSEETAGRLADRLVTELGLERTVEAPPGVEAVRRRTPDGSALFLINHTEEDAVVPASGTDLLTGTAHGPRTTVPAGRVLVLHTTDSE